MMISRLVTPVTLRKGECVTVPPHKNRQKTAFLRMVTPVTPITPQTHIPGGLSYGEPSSS